ncbi:MAG TPA: ester cyclase [Gemmatimonadales bacterium]|nr:ester cyclase [Gemmatimonadales bacterium]
MSDAREQLAREVNREVYHEVRELWKAHSIAEDRRDIPGLIATLTDDCVYEVLPGGTRWEGHAGAVRFYTELISAFPDIHFDLQNIVIGPQGVFEEAKVTGTHKARWLDRKPTGQKVEFRVVIFFPWDLEKKKFKGERVYFFQ